MDPKATISRVPAADAPLSVVVPARDEADTIASVVAQLLPQPWIDEVVVVDNGSQDETAAVAKKAGARVVREARAGMGHAVRAGLAAAKHDWVMKVDADLDRFDIARFAAMAEARGPGIGLVKGNWQDPKDNMPMTRLLVMPALAQLAPGLRTLKAPNSGIYIVNRALIAHQEIVGSYAADLDVMLRVHCSGARVREVDIGQISHDTRNLGHYNAMAETIMAFFMERMDKRVTHETVVLARDAGEVIETALGLLVTRARAGSRVLIYLGEERGPRADVLRTALAGFPTAEVRGVADLGRYETFCATGHVRVIGPYPSADTMGLLEAGLRLQDRLRDQGLSPLEVLMMPPASRADMVHHFQADHGFDISQGRDIKAAAIKQLGRAGAKTVEAREVFQSFASLPTSLKVGIAPNMQQAKA